MNFFFKIEARTRFLTLLLSPYKDTHREKEPSNKTPALRKKTNMGVWALGILNQLCIRGT